MLSVGCLKENNDSDFRVSLTPETSKKLIEKNAAYEKEGHVFFAVTSYKKYGKLSNKNPDEFRFLDLGGKFNPPPNPRAYYIA